MINKITPATKVHLGLNYVYWNLDESITALPNVFSDEESRGIPVLPGTYKTVIQYGAHRDSIDINVIEDPRFELSPEVDIQLYQMQKQLDTHRAQFAQAYNKLQKSDSIVQRVLYQLDYVKIENRDSLIALSKQILEQIEKIRNGGMSSRPKKQVGAWQSFEVNAVSKIKDAQLALMSKTTLPTIEDRVLLEEIGVLVSEFEALVTTFSSSLWRDFEQTVKQENLSWFDE
jgi:hypothetical protein